MYSIWQRAGSLFSFFTSCLFAVLPVIAALNFLIQPQAPPVSISVDNISNRLGVEDYFMNRKVMLTDLLLNLDADFTPLFHWNTKQLFLYITLEYESQSYSRNEIVFYDKIIRSSDRKHLSITGLKNKYPAVDVEDQLPGTEATIKVYWNTVPNVGYLLDTQQGQVSVKIPSIGEKFQRTM